ncbi:MAG: hypothetical protein WBP12_01900 [Candidatus Saccharimonas sp.]
MEFVFGHPVIWTTLLVGAIVGWILYGVVKAINGYRRSRSNKLIEVSSDDRVWPFVIAIVVTIVFGMMALASGMWVRNYTPHNYSVKVLAPLTIAADGTPYVELVGEYKAWICKETDKCAELKPGEYATYTAYVGDDGQWIKYDLRPYVAPE